MAQPISDDTQSLLDAADRAIERCRMTVQQTRQVHAACIRELRAQEVRLAFLRELKKPKPLLK
jgi:hypothetical protein